MVASESRTAASAYQEVRMAFPIQPGPGGSKLRLVISPVRSAIRLGAPHPAGAPFIVATRKVPHPELPLHSLLASVGCRSRLPLARPVGITHNVYRAQPFEAATAISDDQHTASMGSASIRMNMESVDVQDVGSRIFVCRPWSEGDVPSSPDLNACGSFLATTLATLPDDAQRRERTRIILPTENRPELQVDLQHQRSGPCRDVRVASIPRPSREGSRRRPRRLTSIATDAFPGARSLPRLRRQRACGCGRCR